MTPVTMEVLKRRLTAKGGIGREEASLVLLGLLMERKKKVPKRCKNIMERVPADVLAGVRTDLPASGWYRALHELEHHKYGEVFLQRIFDEVSLDLTGKHVAVIPEIDGRFSEKMMKMSVASVRAYNSDEITRAMIGLRMQGQQLHRVQRNFKGLEDVDDLPDLFVYDKDAYKVPMQKNLDFVVMQIPSNKQLDFETQVAPFVPEGYYDCETGDQVMLYVQTVCTALRPGGVGVLILPSGSRLFSNSLSGVSEEIADMLYDQFHIRKLIRIPFGKNGMMKTSVVAMFVERRYRGSKETPVEFHDSDKGFMFTRESPTTNFFFGLTEAQEFGEDTENVSETFDELFDIRPGTRIVRRNTTPGKYPVWGSAFDVSFTTDTCNREEEGPILTISRFGVGETSVRWLQGPLFLNDSAISLHAGKNLTEAQKHRAEWIRAYLFHDNSVILKNCKGSSRLTLELAAFRKARLVVPAADKIVEATLILQTMKGLITPTTLKLLVDGELERFHECAKAGLTATSWSIYTQALAHADFTHGLVVGGNVPSREDFDEACAKKHPKHALVSLLDMRVAHWPKDMTVALPNLQKTLKQVLLGAYYPTPKASPFKNFALVPVVEV